MPWRSESDKKRAINAVKQGVSDGRYISSLGGPDEDQEAWAPLHDGRCGMCSITLAAESFGIVTYEMRPDSKFWVMVNGQKAGWDEIEDGFADASGLMLHEIKRISDVSEHSGPEAAILAMKAIPVEEEDK